MKVLITGGAGFVGSNLARKLQAQGHDVAAFDNLSTGSENNVPDGVKLYQGSILDEEALDEVLGESFCPDAVYHLATSAGVRSNIFTSKTHAELGFLGTINVVDAAVKAGVGKFVFASSGGTVYGEPVVQEPIKETHALNPISAYGVSKVASEKYLEHIRFVHGVPITILRFCNMYGPTMPVGMFAASTFLDLLAAGESPRVFGDGSAVRDYLYIDDAVRALVCGLGDFGGTYNVGTGVGTSINQLVDMCQALTQRYDIKPVYSDWRREEIHYNVLDCSLLYNVQGWAHAVNFRDGLARCYHGG